MEIKNNDQRILEMKKQIEEKKLQLGKAQKFVPITNCSIEFDGVRYNLNVLNRELLIGLLVKINTHVMSAKDLGILDDYNISSFHVLDWVKDIHSKLALLNRKEEENKLKVMEDKLDRLLSEEKKTELEIDEIASFLK